MAIRTNGVLEDTGQQSSIHVKLMRQNALATASPEEVVAFGKRLDDLSRQGDGASSAIKALLLELGAVKNTLLRSSAPGDLRDKARTLELEAMQLQLQLSGDENRAMAGDLGPVSVKQRASVAALGTLFSTYGPTPTHLSSLEIGEQGFASIKTALKRIFDTELPALRKAMDEAGVPWTPGRGVPGED
jgi:hypothetical protein